MLSPTPDPAAKLPVKRSPTILPQNRCSHPGISRSKSCPAW